MTGVLLNWRQSSLTETVDLWTAAVMVARVQVMVRAVYLLGLRRFEAYERRWGRYDERAKTHTVEGKGGKVETLPVVEEMAEWFARLHM